MWGGLRAFSGPQQFYSAHSEVKSFCMCCLSLCLCHTILAPIPSLPASEQGSKLKKSSGRLLATNWRHIVARCKFLVASFYNVNDAAQGLWYISRGREAVKFTKAGIILWNSVEILSRTCLYNIFESYLGKFILTLPHWNVQTTSQNYQA